ncbi:class B sortase [Butyrivibrio sp.]|uniref:class B sortase n=1 Tax=Butyrivibrio sp. TaxID=28121 RepID=UPI0025BD4728|nr:class B sortase [Butyrivibrio sp.]MBQ9302321.1 class B sortase [Butyrivibrio sp.]
MRIIRSAAFAAILLFLGFHGIMHTMNSYRAEEAVEEQLQEVAVAVDKEITPVSQPAEEEVLGVTRKELPPEIAAMAVDFEALKAINADVVAWIYIPAVDISYPVVQGDDNEEYLHMSFDSKKSSAGSVFMNYANSKDFSDENTFVFAHNMKNGSMFGALKSFVWNTETVDSDPYIWIFTSNATYQYEIFSAYNTDKDSDMYQISSDHDEYVESALSQSIITHDCDTDGRLITLSTCAGFAGSGQRLLVHGSLVETY